MAWYTWVDLLLSDLYARAVKASSSTVKCKAELFETPYGPFDHNWQFCFWLLSVYVNCCGLPMYLFTALLFSSAWEVEGFSSYVAFLLSAYDRNGIKGAYCGLSYYLITGCHFKTISKSFSTLCSAIVVPLAFPLSLPSVSRRMQSFPALLPEDSSL